MDHTSSVRLADLIRLGMPALIAEHGTALTAQQRRALDAITECRSGAFGTTAMICDDCGATEALLALVQPSQLSHLPAPHRAGVARATTG